jgi:hypothetical protein
MGKIAFRARAEGKRRVPPWSARPALRTYRGDRRSHTSPAGQEQHRDELRDADDAKSQWRIRDTVNRPADRDGLRQRRSFRKEPRG